MINISFYSQFISKRGLYLLLSTSNNHVVEHAFGSPLIRTSSTLCKPTSYDPCYLLSFFKLFLPFMVFSNGHFALLPWFSNRPCLIWYADRNDQWKVRLLDGVYHGRVPCFLLKPSTCNWWGTNWGTDLIHYFPRVVHIESMYSQNTWSGLAWRCSRISLLEIPRSCLWSRESKARKKLKLQRTMIQWLFQIIFFVS